MKTAQQVAEKFAQRASGASGDYLQGVLTTDKDQNARAIAAADVHKQATIESLNRGDYAKGLRRAGKQAYLEGVQKVGQGRYSEGVVNSATSYAEGSAAFDSARNAAASLPRGPKGSPANIQRVTAVVTALRKAKTGA